MTRSPIPSTPPPDALAELDDADAAITRLHAGGVEVRFWLCPVAPRLRIVLDGRRARPSELFRLLERY